MNNIVIREYNEEDAPFLAAIYYNTVHTINAKDYTMEQINAWAPESSLHASNWIKKWQKCEPIIATIDSKIVGFIEFENNGRIDCFYCHHQYQGCGVGSALLKVVEDIACKKHIKKLFSEVSITAKGFFEANGFKLIKEQLVECRGINFTNFMMEKVILI